MSVAGTSDHPGIQLHLESHHGNRGTSGHSTRSDLEKDENTVDLEKQLNAGDR